jgi:hypothetical protein
MTFVVTTHNPTS